MKNGSMKETGGKVDAYLCSKENRANVFCALNDKDNRIFEDSKKQTEFANIKDGDTAEISEVPAEIRDQDLNAIPEPPDGGWGWFVVAASFFCNMVVDGISYSFGIFLIQFVRYYKSQKGETAWIGSLLTGFYLGSGPLMGALTNKFGCRPVTMAGSVVACLAFALSTIAPSIRVLFFTYGIMGGIGFGMIYLPSIVSVSYYFSTKRALATGIAVCGSGMGAFIFAPLSQTLLEAFEWQGALLIVAGLALNCMVFGAIMRPLKAQKHKLHKEHSFLRLNEQKDVRADKDTSVKQPLLNLEPGVHSTLNIDKVGQKTLKDSYDGLVMSNGYCHEQRPANQQNNFSSRVNGHIPPPNGTITTCRSQVDMKDLPTILAVTQSLQASANVLYPTSKDNCYLIQKGKSYNTHKHDAKDLARPLYRKDIFYSGNISRLPEFQNSRNDVRAYVANVTAIPPSETPSDDAPEKDKTRSFWSKFKMLPESMRNALKLNLDFTLFKELPFCLTCIGNLFGMMGFYIPFVYLVDSSITKGISHDRAAFLISVLGITNLIGKIVFGWIVDRPRVRAMDMNNLCLIVSGIAAASVPFCYSYASIATASAVFSCFAAAYISLISIVLVDMIGLDKLSSSFGLINLFRGAGSIIGPPIAGTVFDVTGSYDVPFFMAGGLLLTSAIFTLSVPCVTRCLDQKIQTTSAGPIARTFINDDGLSGRNKGGTVSAEAMTSV